jgi:hypothetical protein
MKRSSTFAGIGGAAGLMIIGAMLSPVLTNATAAGSEQPVTASASAHAVRSAPAGTHTKTSHVSSAEASDAVVAQVKGSRVVATHASKHNGYKAFAVKVERTDGSTLIGYVDRASGVVFDWSKPTQPATSPSTTTTSTPSSHSEGADDDSSGMSDDDGDMDEDVNDDHGAFGHDDSDDSQYDDGSDSYED